MTAQLYVSQSIVEPLADYVGERGLKLGRRLPIARSSGVALPIQDPKVSAAKVVTLFEALAHDLKDPAFGLKYAQVFPVGGSGALGFIITQAQDLRTAVTCVARYTRIVMPGILIDARAVEGGCDLVWHYPLSLPTPNIQFNSFVAALVVQRLRLGLSPDWYPKRVELAHRDPGSPEDYRNVFGPNLRFERATNKISFIDSNLDRPYSAADPRLYKVVTQLGEILLDAQKPILDFGTEVANAIVDLLGSSPPTLKAVANVLGVGERSIQRKLAGAGKSFEDVLSDTRRHVAERLLSETDLSMTDIAFMLGFSELSAFTRAAKRWHGMSPRQFRAQCRNTLSS